MANPITFAQMKPLVGTWRCADGFSDVEYSIKLRAGVFTVSGVDRDDGEVPEIYDVAWNSKKRFLGFAAHWSSTGRFTKYEFRPSLVNERVAVTYTYSAQELWERA